MRQETTTVRATTWKRYRAWS